MPRPAPEDVFLQTVKYFPTVSINLIIKNPDGETLYLRRANQPAKGQWWLPGGRLYNGETFTDAAVRIAEEEADLKGAALIDVSREYFEELFDTDGYSEEDMSHYAPDITHIHYVTTVAYMEVGNDHEVTLDDQSSDFAWSKKSLSTHPYQDRYFDAMRRMGYDV